MSYECLEHLAIDGERVYKKSYKTLQIYDIAYSTLPEQKSYWLPIIFNGAKSVVASLTKAVCC
jgi:hypothetical protein